MRYKLLTSILIIFILSCSNSVNHKDVYCFLSGTDYSKKERIYFINNENLKLASSGYNLKQTSWSDFTEANISNGEKFIIKKEEISLLKNKKGFNQCNVTYLAENESFILYRYNSTFNSRYLGRVEMKYYCDMKSLHDGQSGVIADGETINDSLSIFRTSAKNPFPLTTRKGINQYLEPGDAVESWIKLRATKLPSELIWVQNFKNDLNTSIFYNKTNISINDTIHFKSFNTFLSPEHILNKNDQFLNYIWNIKNSSIDIQNFQTMVLNPYSGTSRWKNRIKSSFVWTPGNQNKLWQKSEVEIGENRFFHTIKSGKTGMHYSTLLSRELIQKNDSLNIEFDIKGSDLIEADLVIEITDIDNERSLKYNKKVNLSSQWKKHSVNFSLTNSKNTDRLLIYFKNSSKGTIKVSKLQGAVISKIITCN